jgi:hypothetical protein
MTSGVISVNGGVKLFLVDGGRFDFIGTGNSSGAIFLNISQYMYSSSSKLKDCSFVYCNAVCGGALYIAKKGILLQNVNFSGNSASKLGSDIFENCSSSESFYSPLTVQNCCSNSVGVVFALADDSTKDYLLPDCEFMTGERYVSTSNSFDVGNSCLDPYYPCETIGNAISYGKISGQEAFSITVKGEYEDISVTISAGELVHLHSSDNEESV